MEAAIRAATLADAESRQKVEPMASSDAQVGSDVYKCLLSVALIKNCDAAKDESKMVELISRMEVADYHDSDIIIQEGTPAKQCYVILEGAAKVVKEGAQLDTRYKNGELFGELALLEGDVRAASVIAKASRRGICRCVRIDNDTFRELKISNEDNAALLQQRQMAYYLQTKMQGGATPAAQTSADGTAKVPGLVTTVGIVRSAFTQYFDPKMPAQEVNRLLNVGLGRDESDEDQHDNDDFVDIVAFVQSLRKTVIKQYSASANVSDTQKRAEFLRNITDTERQTIKQCFEELDESGDGNLDMEELGLLMQRIYGFVPTAKQLQQLMDEIDTDGNGVVDMEEFISAMATVKEVKIAGDIFKWRQAFDRYDTDNSGELSREELYQLVQEIWVEKHNPGLSMEEEEAEDMETKEEKGDDSKPAADTDTDERTEAQIKQANAAAKQAKLAAKAKAKGLQMDMIQFMVDEADIDGSGEISWWEFCHMMQKMMDGESMDIEKKRQKMIIESEAEADEIKRAALTGAEIAKALEG